MSNEDLWGDLPGADATADPATLLREQAALLGSKTGNVLEGAVVRAHKRQVETLAAAFGAGQNRSDEEEKTVELRFSIRCAALDNYTFHVLTLKYPLLTVFPASMHDEVTGQDYGCRSEDELRSGLQRIFTSPQLRRVISALLREARALTCTVAPF